jgi:hypothetical protein
MIQISKCCESQAVGELHEGAENSTFGKCSDCGDYSFFDNVENSDADLNNWPDEETNKVPYTFEGIETSWDRLQYIGPRCDFPENVIADFNPSVISWVAERLGITAEDGVAQALEDGHFVINTAKEIHNDAQIKMQVEPGSGTVLHALSSISEIVTNVLTTTNQKVVFHCAMGMERSVLACLWFMASQWGMRFDQSFELIKKHRPIAIDRTNWIAL